MKYTANYFKDGMPEWKRKKDPILSRLFYRRLAFHFAAFSANHGINANQVSYFSLFVGILGAILFVFNKNCAIVGALIINLWLVLDCTDGCLARSVKSQPFGEFADGVSSYVLVGLLCTTIGYYVYKNGGVLVPQGAGWAIFLGALASSSDSLMRLIYQKYKNTERELVDNGIIEPANDERTDHSKVNSLRVRIESDLGIGGILPILILLGVIFGFMDIVLVYCLIYYGGSCLLASAITIRKAIIRQ